MKVVLALVLCAAAALAAPPALPQVQLPPIPGVDGSILGVANGIVELIRGLLNVILGVGGGAVLDLTVIVGFVVQSILALASGTLSTLLIGVGDLVQVVIDTLNGIAVNLPAELAVIVNGIACIIRQLLEYIFVTGRGLDNIVRRLLVLLLGDLGALLEVILRPIVLLLQGLLRGIVPLRNILGPIEILQGPDVCALVPLP